MCKAAGQAIAMVDIHRSSVPAVPACGRHDAIGGGAHRVAHFAMNIDPGVHGGRPAEWIEPHAEARRQINFALHWLAQLHARENAAEPVEMSACKNDALNLALEGD